MASITGSTPRSSWSGFVKLTLIGFTRLEAPEELLRGDDDLSHAPLSNNPPDWVPANEVRGEGILLRSGPTPSLHGNSEPM